MEIACAKQLQKQRKNSSGSKLVIKLKPGIVTLLPASQGYFNHILVQGTDRFQAKSSGGINIYRMGNNLLITFTDTSHPADLAIRDLNSDQVYLLALTPQAIPPRSYTVVLSPSASGEEKSAKEQAISAEKQKKTVVVDHFIPVYPLAKPEGYEEGYEGFILDCFTKAALSQKIQGASEQNPWRELVIKYDFEPVRGLTLYSVMRYFVQNYEIDVFLAKNEGKKAIVLKEPYLWREGVLAVSFVYNFFERENTNIVLEPGQSVSVLIARVKE